MRRLSPNTIALAVRSTRQPVFRRCGIDFTPEPRRVEMADLRPGQAEYLLASRPSELEVIEIVAEHVTVAVAVPPPVAEIAAVVEVHVDEPDPVPPPPAPSESSDEAPEPTLADTSAEGDLEVIEASEEGEATPIERPARRRGRKKR